MGGACAEAHLGPSSELGDVQSVCICHFPSPIPVHLSLPFPHPHPQQQAGTNTSSSVELARAEDAQKLHPLQLHAETLAKVHVESGQEAEREQEEEVEEEEEEEEEQEEELYSRGAAPGDNRSPLKNVIDRTHGCASCSASATIPRLLLGLTQHPASAESTARNKR